MINLSTIELNKWLKSLGVDKEKAKKIKGDRRRLKNNGYAVDKRKRKLDEEADLKNQGCNSIDTLNFGRQTGPYSGPHSVLRHYKF